MNALETIREKLEEISSLAESSQQIPTSLMTKITDGVQEILDDIDEAEGGEEEEEEEE